MGRHREGNPRLVGVAEIGRKLGGAARSVKRQADRNRAPSFSWHRRIQLVKAPSGLLAIRRNQACVESGPAFQPMTSRSTLFPSGIADRTISDDAPLRPRLAPSRWRTGG